MNQVRVCLSLASMCLNHARNDQWSSTLVNIMSSSLRRGCAKQLSHIDLDVQGEGVQVLGLSYVMGRQVYVKGQGPTLLQQWCMCARYVMRCANQWATMLWTVQGSWDNGVNNVARLWNIRQHWNTTWCTLSFGSRSFSERFFLSLLTFLIILGRVIFINYFLNF